MTDVQHFAEIVNDSENIVFFGGAGVSTASGIPDFRSSSGIYSEKSVIPPEKILSGDFFFSHTADFYKFYKAKMLYPDAQPNEAHYALAELEKQGKLSAIITQNVDGLHQKAGSKNVIELHGSVYKNKCVRCGAEYGLDFMLSSDGVPKCSKCGGIVKPEIVLYGEALPYDAVIAAEEAVDAADTLIVGGTSLTVYPAAAFAMNFQGKELVVINNAHTQADGLATLVLRGDIAEIFEKLSDELNLR